MADRRGVIRHLIRRYISGAMLKECKDVPIPLGEVALAKRFNTTRKTVQAACECLIGKALVRVPGKRGLFLNPSGREIFDHWVDVRIVCGDGSDMIIPSDIQVIISAVAEVLEDHCGDFQYTTLFSREGDELYEELRLSSPDVFIFLSPDRQIIYAAERLIEEGFPVIIFGNTYDTEAPFPASNGFLADFAEMGEARAKALLLQGEKKVLYYGLKNVTYQRFMEVLRESGFPENKISFFDQNTPGVIEKINTFQPGIIIATGYFFSCIPEFIRSVGKHKDIVLILDNVPYARFLQKKYPFLQIAFHSPPKKEEYMRAGKKAGEMILEFMEKGGKKFSNKYIN